jgi:hypothetical protein
MVYFGGGALADLSLVSVARMSDEEARKALMALRWPSSNGRPICPRCSNDEVFFRKSRRTFLCKRCVKEFSIEIARSATARTDVGTVLSACAVQALEGARLAFQMGLEDLSRDTLKSLADLRKGLGDDAAKLADSTRQLAGSVAGSLVLGLGLVAAKLGTTAPKALIIVLALVLAGYVAAVIVSNLQFVLLQRSIRKEWRGRLYRFLTSEDYQRMVLKPAYQAEQSTFIAMGIGGVLALIMLGAILILP